MSKKYRLLVDSPWGKKGEMFMPFDYYDVTRVSKTGPEDYPQIFEPIVEIDPVDVVAKKIHARVYGCNCYTWDTWTRLAKGLIAAGLDVEKLK